MEQFASNLCTWQLRQQPSELFRLDKGTQSQNVINLQNNIRHKAEWIVHLAPSNCTLNSFKVTVLGFFFWLEGYQTGPNCRKYLKTIRRLCTTYVVPPGQETCAYGNFGTGYSCSSRPGTAAAWWGRAVAVWNLPRAAKGLPPAGSSIHCSTRAEGLWCRASWRELYPDIPMPRAPSTIAMRGMTKLLAFTSTECTACVWREGRRQGVVTIRIRSRNVHLYFCQLKGWGYAHLLTWMYKTKINS